MSETTENRLRRLRMRSWRRGMKEMDMILGPFADDLLNELRSDELDSYETLLEQNDQDLYRWITARVGAGSVEGPQDLRELLDRIAVFVSGKWGQQ